MKPLIFIGGGGHCKSVIEAAESSGRSIKGILDKREYIGRDCLGYKIIGTDEDIPQYVDECEFVITLGFIDNPEPRIRLHELVEKEGGTLAVIIASSAQVSKHATICAGTVVLHHATVNAGAKIGKGCIINTASNVEHDTIVKDYCHISTGAMVNGDCKIGCATFIGSSAVVTNGISIQEKSVIGIGSVVCSDLKEKGTYVGVPATKIR